MLLALTFAISYSQEKGKFRVGLDFGYVPAGGGGGGMISLEPKFNLTDNMNVGLRLGIAGIVKDIQEGSITSTAKVSANSSFAGTYDYYFYKSGSTFVPYIGAGIGYYSLANVEVDDSTSSEDINPAVIGEMGALVRAGFEWGKFRMGVEYNLVPDSDIENLNGDKIGIVSNAYLGIHVGFFVGGGKWGRKAQ